MKNREKMQRLVKNRQAGAGHQPDKQNRWDGNQAGMLVELSHRIVSSVMERDGSTNQDGFERVK